MKNNLGLFLAKRAQLCPGIEAVVEVERGRRFTYAELNIRTNRAAHALLERGVKKGDRVALLMMNGVEYLESYFAAAKIGAVMVPLNWRLVPDELEFIINDSGSTVLIFDDAFESAVLELQGRKTTVKHWLSAGEGAPGTGIESYDAAVDAASEEEPEITASDDDLLFIMYTSGTTGLPKGVVQTHSTTIWASITVNMTADMRYRDRYLQVMPLFHVGALTPATGVIHRGGTLVVMRAFDPNAIFDVIANERITTGLAVPAMLQAMWASKKREGADLSSIRWIMSGAAPVPVSLIEKYAEINIEIQQVYGLTETCGPACLISPEEALAKAGSTGPAFLHTDVRVVSDAGQDVGPGEIGEVIIRGPHIMTEYWNRPEATAETIRDGWLYSGDLATVDKEGFVYIQDRKKDMIISGGENVYPAEIENLLSGHPKIKDVAVIGQPSERWGESPLAIVVPADGEFPEAQDVLDYCNGKLAKFKMPRGVEFVEEIQRNPSGKILKRILRDAFPGPAAE
ncbi:MAG: long-chain fatty acid--CoA ligase [bacterium]|nr:long-chain fatty acid--CoA ligase [bacterium]